jgi:uroporphyrinogen-III decarboxylase
MPELRGVGLMGGSSGVVMAAEIARDEWKLAPLGAGECGPYGDFPRLSNEEKSAVMEAERRGSPTRVPVILGTNNRVFMLDRRFDAGGLTYERFFTEPEAVLVTQLRWQHVCRFRHHHFCDLPTSLPEVWRIGLDLQNVYEAAFFGAEVRYPAGEVPDTRPILADGDKRAIFDVEIDRPLENPYMRRMIDLAERVREMARGCTFFGRPIEVAPFAAGGSDGPLTVAMSLRGPAMLMDMKRDPEYAHELLAFIVSAALNRRAAFQQRSAIPEEEEAWFADDSIAMLGPAQYRQFVLPQHRRWYDAIDPERKKVRGMHLCGDATRHFRTIREECGVTVFDTGFPVDFARLRNELGEDVKIIGGVEVPRLVQAGPEEVYQRAREILTSGVLAGGRFVLREGNNLPPGVRWENLAAMYRAAFDFGAFV